MPPRTPRTRPLPVARAAVLLAAVTLLLAGCGRNMFDQPRADPNEASPFFPDGSVNQPVEEGTLSRDEGAVDPAFASGQGPDGPLTELPVEPSIELLRLGQERYNVFCAPCHGYDGSGNGMIVQRGFPQPTSFHQQRLLDAPVGYYVNAIANGFGRMFPYASRVPPEERWAIAAYVRALQVSQNAAVDDLPDDLLEQLDGAQGASAP